MLSENNQRDEGRDDTEKINAAVSIWSDNGHEFVPSEVVDLDCGKPGKTPAKLKISTFSIAGRTGPLPEPYKEFLTPEETPASAFIDMFNHRLNVLRFQIKKKSNPGLEDKSPEASFLSLLVKNITGFGTGHLEERWPLSLRELMLFSGLLASKRKGAPVIRNILSYYLDTEVKIVQFQESRHEIAGEDRTYLTRTCGNNRLGEMSILGTRYYDRHSRIKIICGPLSYSQFLQLLPGGGKHDRFRQLVRFLTDDDLDCTIVLTLLRKVLPLSRLSAPTRLGVNSSLPCKIDNDRRMRLKRNSWLKSRP
ncbi:MAG: type VI secretion system baseplate subunit TssG, partial [Desulfobacterales bacterium]|nr:type VI secretion system baseplate subunit TssG [Desulfobacterales bacterium]